MDIVSRKKVNVLIQLAQADHELLQSEIDLIYDIGKKNRISKEEIDDLFSNPEPVGSLGALSSDQKFDYLYDSIRIIKADGVIKKSEIIFTQSVAINLGLHKDIVEEMIYRVDIEANEEKNREQVKSWFMRNAI